MRETERAIKAEISRIGDVQATQGKRFDPYLLGAIAALEWVVEKKKESVSNAYKRSVADDLLERL